MGWVGQGRIYASPGDGTWKHQFAMLPTPHLRENGDLRIFLGFCDPGMVGRVGYIDVDPQDPSAVRSVSAEPVLDIGVPGAFDDNGVVPISLVRAGDALHLYYIGFQLGVRVPYFMFAGLAVSRDDGETFHRVQATPVLERNPQELYARCGCHVIHDEGRWRMWYIGSLDAGWTERDGKKVPLYTVRYVESRDGVHWTPGVGTPCMTFRSVDEHGFGRPFVRKTPQGYEMLLSVRTYSRGYYLAQATSLDGVTWARQDGDLEISNRSAGDWDSENTCYAHAFEIGGQSYLFYNGNGYGKSGVGFARWDGE